MALLWSNPWVQRATAVCAGAGSGLFIDEVGKFITRQNDYFTPLAAPATAHPDLQELARRLRPVVEDAALDLPEPRTRPVVRLPRCGDRRRGRGRRTGAARRVPPLPVPFPRHRCAGREPGDPRIVNHTSG
jgi:hypothetical protein